MRSIQRMPINPDGTQKMLQFYRTQIHPQNIVDNVDKNTKYRFYILPSPTFSIKSPFQNNYEKKLPYWRILMINLNLLLKRPKEPKH